MAAGVTIKAKGKAGAFVTTELSAREIGIDTTNGHFYLSTDGTDVVKIDPSAAGDVTKVGTPVANELGVWTGDGTIAGKESGAAVTWNGQILDINMSSGIFNIGGTTIFQKSGGGIDLNAISSLDATTIATFDAALSFQSALTFGIADGNAVDIDVGATIANNDYAKWSTTGLIGQTYAEVRTDLGLVIGTNVQAWSAALDAVSGTNTGDQTITLTGDVTGTGTGSFATTIAAGAVDVAMLANGTDGELITWNEWGAPATVSAGTSGQILTSNGVGAAPTFQAAASGDATTSNESETGHGFTVGELVYDNAGTWAKAKADAEATAEVIGMVSVSNTNDFDMVTGGYVSGLTGLTANTLYWLSTTTAGAMQTTAPTTNTHVDKPVFWATSTTTGYFLNYRGMVVGGAAPGTILQYVAQEYDPSAKLSLTSTYADITGSDYSFTPVSASSTIKYSYSFHMASDGDSSVIAHAKLFVDGVAETESATSYGTVNASYLELDVVYEHALSSWGTSAKTIKTQAREYSAAQDTKLFETRWMDGSASAVLKRATLTIIESE